MKKQHKRYLIGAGIVLAIVVGLYIYRNRYGFKNNDQTMTAPGRPGGRTYKHPKQNTNDPIGNFVNQAPMFNVNRQHMRDRGNVTGDIQEPTTTDDIAAAIGLKP